MTSKNFSLIYEPAEDSFLLEKEVKKLSNGKSVLDIGTGNGIQAEAAKNSGAKKVFATDINEKSIALCKSKGISSVVSNLFENINEKFDLIVFNPPYLPKDEREDSESALITEGGKKGDEIIIEFLKNVGDYLNPNGKILLLLSSLTPKKRILKMLREKNFAKRKLSKQKIFMETLEVLKIYPRES